MAQRSHRTRRTAARAVDQCEQGRRVRTDNATQGPDASLRRAPRLWHRHHWLHGRDDEAEGRLVAAIAKSGFAAIRSLRRPPDQPDETCWLAGDGWWLSTASLDM